MEWIESVNKAINYIEEHLLDELDMEEISRCAYISPFYFQKGFAMLCCYSVADYIRMRRLALAGGELATTDEKIIDIAVKYGYDSPDSFTKAFTRFHGATPTSVRKDGAAIKSFAPLKILFTLKGGNSMDCKIVKKESFKVLGTAKTFSYENAKKEIPKFWAEFYQNGGGKFVCGEFGVNIDESMGSKDFIYMIADAYRGQEVPDGFEIKTIPEFTWAVFPCIGAMPKAMQSTNEKIFSEWLASCEYEFAAGYCIEMYSDMRKYKNGLQDEEYYSELWIPVKKKA